ncbi:hypothetical protein Avbf_09909, partial [Armadillidium vulgare]
LNGSITVNRKSISELFLNFQNESTTREFKIIREVIKVYNSKPLELIYNQLIKLQYKLKFIISNRSPRGRLTYIIKLTLTQGSANLLFVISMIKLTLTQWNANLLFVISVIKLTSTQGSANLFLVELSFDLVEAIKHKWDKRFNYE